jgi:GMP synthase (glutamine-hydrolysing)
MQPTILILDFGSQYTQLIARRIRELNIYCEIQPYHHSINDSEEIKGIILSGSPSSVYDENHPEINLKELLNHKPVLGICYGAQLMAKQLGGIVTRSTHREYGRAKVQCIKEDDLFKGMDNESQVWMSHGDAIQRVPESFEIIAATESIPVAAMRGKPDYFSKPVYGLQFHPEVTHSLFGKDLLYNFCVTICGCDQSWTAESYIEETISRIKNQVGNDKVVMALSGGVDSTVAATLVHRAIGANLYCIFVDNGLLRKNEFEQVLDSYRHMGLNIKGVDAKQAFYTALQGVSEPEQKRKIIGRLFIDIFDKEAHQIQDVQWLCQGTIYPDVIESVSVHGPSVTIKSHHNVGGLPEEMKLKVLEPLRMLFKDEVRRVGHALNIDSGILNRHPFPGPGLGIRILGDITPDKVRILQEADAIFISLLKSEGWYDKVWQAGVILLPVQSVGVMGDERTYEQVVALRAVESVDGMTADWSHLPYSLLARVSNEIINKVKGINRVVYDISSKPPATIEWE